MTIAIMILMVGVTGKIIASIGYKATLVIGLLILTTSLIWFSLAPVDGSFTASVLGPSLLGALGMSLAYIPGTIASMSGARQEETGLASGIVSTTYQVGSAIGLAIAVGVAISVTKEAGISSKETINMGFQAAFVTAAIVSALSAVVALIGIKQSN
jgi:MFS family permease